MSSARKGHFKDENDPKDGRKKLKVTATMKRPNKMGGIVVVDYIIRASLNDKVESN